MIFTETSLPGAYVIEIEKREDARGFFARSFCQHEFLARGLAPTVAQANISYNRHTGTLRGMHYQGEQAPGTKLVRCVRGGLYDVIIDLRPGSATYLQWTAVELSGENYRMLYIPQMFAHGFLTLSDDTEVLYLESQFYTPGAEKGARYDDPAFAIAWPQPIHVISEKDRNWPDFNDPANLC
ncbi:MAG: dTDP-4-dehydrorhamnose 3,5-epimerase [Chloroflexi bacterium]|nr:dTDP-4-dehydrorhamnose 3,5-epimerase [Chloroflexota bacterium]